MSGEAVMTLVRRLVTTCAVIALLLVGGCTSSGDDADYDEARRVITADLMQLPGVESADLKVHGGGIESRPAIYGYLFVAPGTDLIMTVEAAYRVAVMDTTTWTHGSITLTARVIGDDTVIADARDLGMSDRAVSLDQARQTWGR